MRLLLLVLLYIAHVTFSQIKPEVVLTSGHNDQINCMVMSANSKFLASAGNNKIIKVWDVLTTREFRTISGTNGRIQELDFNKSGTILAGISSSEELYVWDVISGNKTFQIPASSSSRGLVFINDDADIIFTSENGQVSFLNLSSGEVNSIPDIYSVEIISDRVRGKSYVLDYKGSLLRVDHKTQKKEIEYRLFDAFMYPFAKSSISSDGKYIAFGFVDDKLRLFDTEKGAIVYESNKYVAKMVELRFDVTKPHLYMAFHGGTTKLFDYKKRQKIAEIENSDFSVTCMESDPRGGTIILANMDLIRFYDTKRNVVFKSLKSQTKKILNMAFDQKGKYLAVASDKININVWDLQRNKVVRNINAFFPCQFTPDGKYLIAMNFMLNLGVFDINSGKQLKEFKTDSELIQSIAISSDGSTLAGAGFMNVIKLWDFKTSKRLANLKGHEGGIMCLDFHPNKPWLASGSYDQSVRVWDYSTEQEIQKFTDQIILISDVKFNPDGSLLASSSWDKTIHLRETENWSKKHVLKGHVNSVMSIDFNQDGKILASGASNNAVSEADNSLIFWDVESGLLKCRIKGHDGEISKVIFDRSNDRVFTSSDDGTVKYNSYERCEVIATFVSINDKEFLVFTPDNYYMASKKALQSIAFRIGDRLVPFEQFDIYLNRPDVVTKRIGKASDHTIRAYYYLYKKRLKRLNIEESSLKLEFNIPSILNETQPKIVTSEVSQKFWIKSWDNVSFLKQINVYVNDVPIYGENGFVIKEKVKSYRKEFNVSLVEGVNKIQFSCLNEQGAESFYETVEIIRERTEKKNTLYIAAIGVSDYVNAAFNLKYPSKDVADFVERMRMSSDLYDDIKVKLLLNEDATVSNFQSLDEFFEPATHEDLAMIFIAGHGVLDEDFDYFFATYDMDFNAPKLKGLAYDKIHALLNAIKAYKKLLIMDTCHAGELDKDEVEQGPDPEIEDGDVQFRAVGAGVRNKEGFGSENSVGYLEDVFSDTRKGSGATVIASAGGAEYAMESDQWKNGLFTYCFLSGLINKNADLNLNGFIEVSEIRVYVNQMVTRLSGGKQKPTSREDNISQDYAIFVTE